MDLNNLNPIVSAVQARGNLVGDSAAKDGSINQIRTTSRNQVVDTFFKVPPEQRDQALQDTARQMIEQEVGVGFDLQNMGKYWAAGPAK